MDNEKQIGKVEEPGTDNSGVDDPTRREVPVVVSDGRGVDDGTREEVPEAQIKEAVEVFLNPTTKGVMYGGQLRKARGVIRRGNPKI